MSCAGAVGQSEEAQVDYFVAWMHGYVVRAEQLEDAACLRVIDACARACVPLSVTIRPLHVTSGQQSACSCGIAASMGKPREEKP